MLSPSCVRLSTLASILREEYRRRSVLDAENPDPNKIMEADASIARATELLSQHREYCPICKEYERDSALRSSTRKTVDSEHEMFRLDRIG
jgi:hypothetical protein